MFEINPKFFNRDGSLDVDAACAAGRKERARIIGLGARRAWRAMSKAFSIFYGAVGKSVRTTPRPVAER